MKISNILKSEKVGISCELFPPKIGSQLNNVRDIVKEMALLKPSYMSITYGATGGTSEYTVDIANEIQNIHLPIWTQQQHNIQDMKLLNLQK